MKKNILNKLLLGQFGKFLVTGGLNTGIDFGVLYLLMVITGENQGIYTLIFPAVSFSVATVNSFFMNKYWTFSQKKSRSQKEEAKSFAQFMAISIGGLLINAGVVYLVSNFVSPFLGLGILSNRFSQEKIQSLWVLFAKAMATGISLIWNFVGYKFWVFKK
ncbi:MAG: GtrA family protein [Patescibacteria group bacterium]|nr:GtrA family protein [Patescibacteria group bacterium]